MTLGNPQKQRKDAIFKAATVSNVPLQISTSKFHPILQHGPSADMRKKVLESVFSFPIFQLT